MKKLDKQIIAVLITIILSSIFIGLIFHPIITLQVIGVLLSLTYFFFVVSHAALLMPIVAIGTTVDDLIKPIYSRLKDKSIIIARVFQYITIAFSIVAIHITWGYLSVSLVTNNYTFNNYLEVMSNL